MQVWFVFSLIFSMLVAIFAVLNSGVVPIKLYWIDYQLSQSLVILLSAVLGAMIAIFLGIFNKIKLTLKIRELNSTVKSLEQKIIELKNKNIVPQTTNISSDDSETTNREQKNNVLLKNE